MSIPDGFRIEVQYGGGKSMFMFKILIQISVPYWYLFWQVSSRIDLHRITLLTLNLNCPSCKGFWQGFTSGSKKIFKYNTNFYTVWDAKKFWIWPKCFFRGIVAGSPRILRNWQGSRCGSMWVEPGRCGFNSVRTGLKSGCVWLIALITIYSGTNSGYVHLDQTQIVILKVTTRVDAVLRCRLRRVNVVWTGSIRMLIQNCNPCKKILKMLRRIVVHGILRNSQKLWCGWPGWYSFNCSF